MGNSLRCCLACILPCGALDLIRIVHLNGEVEEYSRPLCAKEILDANPNHVISKPRSQGASHRIMIVSPESELKRGSIYFLIPASAIPEKKRRIKAPKRKGTRKNNSTSITSIKEHVRVVESHTKQNKRGGHQCRKSGRVAEWRPNLESIHED